MTVAANVIEKFGGLSRLARALGHKNPTTVQGWQDSGFIPAHRMAEVLAAAKREGIELRPEELVPLPEEPQEAAPGTPQEAA
jgi:hypothetical protein